METMAQVYKEFLETCETREEWSAMLDLALSECLGAGNSRHGDRWVWLYFQDDTSEDVKCNVREEV
jgi:hypothetical protein